MGLSKNEGNHFYFQKIDSSNTGEIRCLTTDFPNGGFTSVNAWAYPHHLTAPNNSLYSAGDPQTQGTRPTRLTGPWLLSSDLHRAVQGQNMEAWPQRWQTRTSSFREQRCWLGRRKNFPIDSPGGRWLPHHSKWTKTWWLSSRNFTEQIHASTGLLPLKSLLAMDYEVTPARNAWVCLGAKVINVVFWLRTMGLMASFHRPSCSLHCWLWHHRSVGLTYLLPKSWRALRSYVLLHILQIGSSTVGMCQEATRDFQHEVLICGWHICYLTLPSCTSAGWTGALLVGLGKLWQSPACSGEGLDNFQETRDERTRLSGLCCLGHVVPSQFLEASVQEEGSALHKLVGDLVDSHRFLSLFIIVSPILWGKNGPVSLMRWFKTVGTMALWDFKGPVQALTETFMNMYDLEQS